MNPCQDHVKRIGFDALHAVHQMKPCTMSMSIMLFILLLTSCGIVNKKKMHISRVETVQSIKLCSQSSGVKISMYIDDKSTIRTSAISFIKISDFSGCVPVNPSELAEIGSTSYDYSDINNPELLPINFLSEEVMTECRKAQTYEDPVFVVIDLVSEESINLWPILFELKIYSTDQSTTNYVAIQPAEAVNLRYEIGFCNALEGEYISLIFIVPENIADSISSLSVKCSHGTVHWQKDNV